jgi:hypothetical protein
MEEVEAQLDKFYVGNSGAYWSNFKPQTTYAFLLISLFSSTESVAQFETFSYLLL